MAIFWAEGFDDGVTRGNLFGNDLPTIQTTVPRTGTRSLKCQTGGASRSSYYGISHPAIATGITSFGLHHSSINNLSPLWAAYDNASNHLTLRLRGDGKFEFTRAGTALATGTFVYSNATHVHLQLKWLIHDSTGTVELRINGSTTPDITFTGDTRNAANALISQQLFGHIDNGFNNTGILTYFDDFVLQDLTGAAPENDWLGETEVKYLFPNGAGDDTDFAIGGSAPAATVWESLDEVPVDDGTTMVTSSTPTDKVTTTFTDLGTTGTIYAVAALMRAKKAAAGTRILKQSSKVGGTEVLGNDHALSTSWQTYQHVFHRDPASAVWTTTNVNAIKAGFELTV